LDAARNEAAAATGIMGEDERVKAENAVLGTWI
jgi:hypothetical protein